MCVIIVKPAGQQFPSDDILRRAHAYNPHGCGFASTNHHYKGMDFDKFLEHLHKVDESEACIIHMRYATHGSIKTANCHPFRDRGVWFAHNGILPITPIGDMTDSETAFRTEIAPVIRECGFGSKDMDEIATEVAGVSRFAFLKGKDIRTYGRFFKMRGCEYSNLNFMPRFAY